MNIFSDVSRRQETFSEFVMLLNADQAGEVVDFVEKAKFDLNLSISTLPNEKRLELFAHCATLLVSDRYVKWDTIQNAISRLTKVFEYDQIPPEVSDSLALMKRLCMSCAGMPIPMEAPDSIFLKRGENLLFSVNVDMMDERVIDRQYVGGSHGFSFRIAKGISYRVGSHAGHVVSRRGMVSVSDGTLYLTDQRVIFDGSKSFSYPLGKVFHVEALSDGLAFSVQGREKSRIFRISSTNIRNVMYIMMRNALRASAGTHEIRIKQNYDRSSLSLQYDDVLAKARKAVGKRVTKGRLLIAFGIFIVLVVFWVFSSGEDTAQTSKDPVTAEASISVQDVKTSSDTDVTEDAQSVPDLKKQETQPVAVKNVSTVPKPDTKKERIEKECNCGVTVMSYSYICSVTKQTKENCLAKFNNEPAAKMCEGVMSDADKIKLIERVYTDKQFQELAKKGTGELAATCISNRMND
nr:MAG TPA: II Vacuolar protein sorting protein 36 Vps36 [Caudoviricetes sp.]